MAGSSIFPRTETDDRDVGSAFSRAGVAASVFRCYAPAMNIRRFSTLCFALTFLAASDAGASARHHWRPHRWSAWSLSFSQNGRDGSSEVYAENRAQKPSPGPSDWGAVQELVAFCRDHKAGFEIKTDGGAWGYSEFGPAYGVTYQVNDGAPVNSTWLGSDTGDTALLTGDALGFLDSLPDEGVIAFTVADSFGASHQAAFRLRGLATARRLIAGACAHRY
jgi:hypothetical protein